MIEHPFICADSGLRKLMKFSKAKILEWEYELSASFDVWVSPAGNILATTLAGPNGSGVVELNSDGVLQFEYYTDSEVFGCQPLAEGNILIGKLSDCRLIEINRQKEVIFELKLKCPSSFLGHDSMRMPRKLANGNYLICHKGEQIVREYDCSGKIIHEIPSPGPVFVAIRLANGNTLFSSEEEVREVDANNNIVWKLDDQDVPKMGIKLITGLQRLPNGNTVVCNWLGHSQEGCGVPLFEVNHVKEVVWKFDNVIETRNVGNFQLLDIKGDPSKNEIYR